MARVRGQGLSEMNKLFQAHRLGTYLCSEVRALENLFQFLGGPIVLKQLEHHLATLGKTAFNNPPERGFLLRSNQRLISAHQADAGRVHVRFRTETSRRNFE